MVAAKALCLLFAVLGTLPVVLGMTARSAWARAWASRETTRLLRERGVEARYGIDVRLWPMALELTRLEVASSDGGAPALTSPRVSVRPRFFALLSGKLAIDQVEVDAPKVRAVLRAGKLANLDLKLPERNAGKSPTIHAPFSIFSIADAKIDLDIDGVLVTADEVDLDVTNDDDPEHGSSFEVAVRAGEATLVRRRAGRESSSAAIVDDDALCAIDGRFRIEPHAILVRRLNASGSADLDVAEGTRPSCHLPPNDKRNVVLALNHLRVEKHEDVVRVDGHVRARAPLGLAERLVAFPRRTGGWASTPTCATPRTRRSLR